MKVLSLLPGRVRLKEENLYKNEDISQLVEFFMNDLDGVLNCRANSITGSIVITYNVNKIKHYVLINRIKMLLTTESPYVEYIKKNYKDYLEADTELKIAKRKMFTFGCIYGIFKVKQYFFGKFYFSRSLPILQLAAIVTIIKGYPSIKRIYKKLLRYFPTNEDKLLLVIGMFFTFIREGNKGTSLLFLKAFTDAIEAYTRLENKKLLLENSNNPLNLMWYENSNKEYLIPLNALEKGDIVTFYEGESIPITGTIVNGDAHINQIHYTGQPEVVKFTKGDKVSNGMTITKGKINVKIEEIIDIIPKVDLELKDLNIKQKVERYQNNQIYIASIMATASYFITRSTLSPLAVLLTMSSSATKTSLNSGLSNHIKLLRDHKIALRNINTIEKIINANSIVFDKTGTLTKDKLKIANMDILDEHYTKDTILEACAACEAIVRHPVAYTLQSSLKGDLKDELVSNTTFIPSKGIVSDYDNHKIIIGNQKLLKDQEIEIDYDVSNTDIGNYYLPIYVAIDNKLVSIIYMIEEPETDAKYLISELKRRNLDDISIISGDLQKNVAALGKIVGIDQVYGDMTSKDKEKYINNKKKNNTVIMIGDGINDTEAMKVADVSISYSDKAAEGTLLQSDCILSHHEMSVLLDLLDMTQNSYKKIRGNINFSKSYNYVFGTLSMLGYINPFKAKSLNTLNSIISIFNSAKICQPNKY